MRLFNAWRRSLKKIILDVAVPLRTSIAVEQSSYVKTVYSQLAISTWKQNHIQAFEDVGLLEVHWPQFLWTLDPNCAPFCGLVTTGQQRRGVRAVFGARLLAVLRQLPPGSAWWWLQRAGATVQHHPPQHHLPKHSANHLYTLPRVSPCSLLYPLVI